MLLKEVSWRAARALEKRPEKYRGVRPSAEGGRSLDASKHARRGFDPK